MNHQLLKKITLLLSLLLCSTFIASGQATTGSQLAKPAELQADESDGGELIENIKRGDLAEVAKVLFGGTSPDAVDKEGGNALCWAVRGNRRDLVQLLLTKGADVNKDESDGGPALAVAAAGGHAQMVKLLLSHGAVVDHKDHGGHTALIVSSIGAVLKEMPPFVLQWIMGGDQTERGDELRLHMGLEHKRVMELLLQAGADANIQADDCGLTALMVAAMAGNVELVQLLLRHGANASLKSDDWDALAFAEAFESPEAIANLLADEDQETKQGLLIWGQITASGRQQVAKILRAAGAQ